MTSSFFQKIAFTALFLFFTFQFIQAQENNKWFVLNSISETEFRNALKNNYNATYVTNIEDSAKLEKAYFSISKTYNNLEKKLAEEELCKTPRCLTSFKAYYPTLNLYLFYILDLHYEKACFVYANTNEMASKKERFRGSYGVMSKDGYWIGLERQDCDNSFQFEVCKILEKGALSLFKYDLKFMDINPNEGTPIFWSDKNTIDIAVREYDRQADHFKLKYYEIILHKD